MKFCTQCGTQLHDDDIFCTKCGNKIPQLGLQEKAVKPSNNISHENPQRTPEQYYFRKQTKSKINKLINIFNFDDIGEKCRQIPKAISKIYKVIFLFVLLVACIPLIFSLFNGFFFQLLLMYIILIPFLYVSLILAHIPLWKFYAFGDIYDSLCTSKTRTDKDVSSN